MSNEINDIKYAGAHLTPKSYDELKKLADEKKWSVKKYLENLIEDHLKEHRKKK